MNKAFFMSFGILVFSSFSPEAQAQIGTETGAGDVQIKLLATYVIPDGKITKVKLDNVGLPMNSQTKANDNVVPTIVVEYFAADNISIETIAGVTQHDVDGVDGFAGAEAVSNAKIIPATLTVKYHFGDGKGFKPYVGAGPSYFLFLGEKSGATTKTLGANKVKLDDSLGFALQTGFDLPLNENGLSMSLDAKRYFLKTDASWFVGNNKVLETRHKLDPWVISAGVAYRF
ncbi:hypothetical protein LPB140_02735 [Sphingorhabdus lutea]|uniref:OmpW family protein n=1 Tax=Sphingorhabdus lutea TaxID=1913578 RepID=A0A1L3J9Y2_9SPHN|nr:OmpW family outer membrane protein [Sphingorhabdus lutea]APG61920.1 hypothetical protein LPB140_02735 [Sphingorhabdus lutea]